MTNGVPAAFQRLCVTGVIVKNIFVKSCRDAQSMPVTTQVPLLSCLLMCSVLFVNGVVYYITEESSLGLSVVRLSFSHSSVFQN